MSPPPSQKVTRLRPIDADRPPPPPVPLAAAPCGASCRSTPRHPPSPVHRCASLYLRDAPHPAAPDAPHPAAPDPPAAASSALTAAVPELELEAEAEAEAETVNAAPATQPAAMSEVFLQCPEVLLFPSAWRMWMRHRRWPTTVSHQSTRRSGTFIGAFLI